MSENSPQVMTFDGRETGKIDPSEPLVWVQVHPAERENGPPFQFSLALGEAVTANLFQRTEPGSPWLLTCAAVNIIRHPMTPDPQTPEDAQAAAQDYLREALTAHMESLLIPIQRLTAD